MDRDDDLIKRLLAGEDTKPSDIRTSADYDSDEYQCLNEHTDLLHYDRNNNPSA